MGTWARTSDLANITNEQGNQRQLGRVQPSQRQVYILQSFCSSFVVVSPAFSPNNTRRTRYLGSVLGQIRLAAPTPCNKWAGALPPRGARSQEALAGLRLPETRPQRPKNRLGVTASARAGGRGAGPGPPASLPRGRPSAASRGRGRLLDAAAPPGSRPAPGEPAPHPHAAPRSRSARPPALRGASGREEGRGDGSRRGGVGGGPAPPGGAHCCAPASRGRPGRRAAGPPLTQEAPRPAATSPQLCGGARPAGNSPGAEGRGAGGRRRGRAGRGAGGPGAAGGAARTCHGAAGARAAAAAAGWWLGEAGRREGAQPERRRGGSGASAPGALIAAVTWPRALPAPARILAAQRPRDLGFPSAVPSRVPLPAPPAPPRPAPRAPAWDRASGTPALHPGAEIRMRTFGQWGASAG